MILKAVKAPYHCLISRCFLAEIPHFVVAFLNHGFERDDEYLDSIARSSKEQMGKVVDELLDRILD